MYLPIIEAKLILSKAKLRKRHNNIVRFNSKQTGIDTNLEKSLKYLNSK